MQPGEILSLTWDQIDLQTGLIRFSDHDVDMGARTQRLLSDVWARQKDAPTDRVFIAPATGNPIDQSRLSVLCRTAMIRGGLEASPSGLSPSGHTTSSWRTSSSVPRRNRATSSGTRRPPCSMLHPERRGST